MRHFIVLSVCAVVTLAGCASYRSSSNISGEAPANATAGVVLIAEDGLSNRRHQPVGQIEVSIKKLTVFHKNPTREQADEALTEKARAIGADAVINVKYKSGVGLTTWGYMDASGLGVKLLD